MMTPKEIVAANQKLKEQIQKISLTPSWDLEQCNRRAEEGAAVYDYPEPAIEWAWNENLRQTLTNVMDRFAYQCPKEKWDKIEPMTNSVASERVPSDHIYEKLALDPDKDCLFYTRKNFALAKDLSDVSMIVSPYEQEVQECLQAFQVDIQRTPPINHGYCKSGAPLTYKGLAAVDALHSVFSEDGATALNIIMNPLEDRGELLYIQFSYQGKNLGAISLELGRGLLKPEVDKILAVSKEKKLLEALRIQDKYLANPEIIPVLQPYDSFSLVFEKVTTENLQEAVREKYPVISKSPAKQKYLYYYGQAIKDFSAMNYGDIIKRAVLLMDEDGISKYNMERIAEESRSMPKLLGLDVRKDTKKYIQSYDYMQYKNQTKIDAR